MLLASLLLFADDAPAAPEPNFWNNPMFMMLIIMALFFLLVILPSQRKEKRDRETLMQRLKKNDEVITSAGIIGIVHSIKDTGDEVTLKLEDSGKLRVLKSSIVRIVTKEGTA